MRRAYRRQLENVQTSRNARVFSSFLPLVAARVLRHRRRPPFTAISTAVEAAKATSIAIAGQNVSWSKEGASPRSFRPMLAKPAAATSSSVTPSAAAFRETDDNVAKNH